MEKLEEQKEEEEVEVIRLLYQNLPKNFEELKEQMVIRALEHLIRNDVNFTVHEVPGNPEWAYIGIPEEILKNKEKLNNFLFEVISKTLDFGVFYTKFLEVIYFVHEKLKFFKTKTRIPKATLYRYLNKSKWIEEKAKELEINEHVDRFFELLEKVLEMHKTRSNRISKY